jgi:hypothetical protein
MSDESSGKFPPLDSDNLLERLFEFSPNAILGTDGTGPSCEQTRRKVSNHSVIPGTVPSDTRHCRRA